MNRYTVTEGKTGVLELVDGQGHKEIFQPDCDLDKAQTLLYEFYELKTTQGIKVKDAFQKEGIDWFPTAVSLLYWFFFFQFVKYRPLVEAYINGEKDFSFNSTGNFSNLIRVIKKSQSRQRPGINNFVKEIYHSLIQLRNQFVVRRRGDVFFFRYLLGDFRTNEIHNDLYKKYRVTQVVGVTWRDLVEHLFDSQVYFLTNNSPFPSFRIRFSNDVPAIYRGALDYVQDVINTHMRSYHSHARLLRSYRYKIFLGIDDANYIYPVLYAAQDAGMKALGIQHGIYARQHEAYILHGIERYRWYDHVLVWGQYWKDVILKHSRIFSKDFHIVASNKHAYDYASLPKKGKEKTILVPYEFLADSIGVGQYIKQFIVKGFKVYFKVRSDELLKDQLQAYYLGEDSDRVEIVVKISPAVMAEVDIIAGTQTTLLFDLLPYGKPVWILDTPFRLLYDMPEKGFARLITQHDMEKIDEIYEAEVSKLSNLDSKYIFGNKPVTQAIEEYLSGRR